tara:strand:+ start:5863 stop:6852 length:990 start_codon:yes stop_codon:yes gene_type:complete
MVKLLNNLQAWSQNGYAGTHLKAQSAEVTDTDVATGGLGIEIAAALVQFNKANVMAPLVTMAAAPAGTSTVKFPIYTKHDASDGTFGVKEMAAGAEVTDANLTDIETTAVSVEVLRRAIRAEVTDLVAHGHDDALLVNAAAQLGNDIAKKFDLEVCGHFDSFTNAVGVSTEGLRFLDIMDGLAKLEANDAPRPYSAVLHPQQMFGSFGLSNEFGSSSVATSNAAFNGLAGSGGVADQFIGRGLVTNIAGIDFYTSTSVPDGADATIKKGAIFAKTALGVGFIDFGGGNFMQMATEREEVQAKTVLVANAYYAKDILVNAHGVEVHTEIS